MTEAEYLHSHTILTNEVENIIESFYVDREISDFAGKNIAALHRMNANPLFWTVTAHALQTSFIITLGRVFDRNPKSHSIHKLLVETVAHPEFFSKAALRHRKLRDSTDQEPEWLPGYLLEAWEPDAAALEKLRDALTPSSDKYDAAFKDIRSKLYAHRDILDRAGIQAIINRGLLVDLEDILYTLHDLLECITQLIYNGTKPFPGARKYDYEERIRNATRKTLNGLITVSSTAKAQPENFS